MFQALIGLGVIVTLTFTVGFWYLEQTRQHPLPVLHLSGSEPAVAKVIENHLADARENPKSARAWGNLGSVLRAYHFDASAIECLTEAERLNPKNPRWPYFLSLLRINQTREKALSDLQRAVELCGNDPEMPRLRLARYHAEAGEWAEAEVEVRKLLNAKPMFGPALLLSARHAGSRGDLCEAVALAKESSQDPRSARASAIYLTSLYARQGDTNAARELANRLGSLPADEPVADPFEAEAAILRQDPRALTEQTHPLLAAGRLREAEPIIERLVTEHADYSETWLLAGRFRFLMKDLASAEKALIRHLKLDPRSSQGLFQLGMVQLGLQRFEEASETFQHATDLKPDFGPAFYNRGFALARAGELQSAVPAFLQAVRLNPERIDSYLMLAEIALRLGDLQEAANHLEKAKKLNSDHPGVTQLIGKLQAAGKRTPLRKNSGGG